MKPAPAADAQLALAHLHRIEAQNASLGNANNRRSFKRYVVRGEAYLRPADRHARLDIVIEAHLRDVGRGGLGFTCGQPLPTNSLWVISFTHQGIVLTDQTIQIRHIRKIDGGGCFLHGAVLVMSDATLAMLGVQPHDIDQSCFCSTDGQDSVGDFVLPDHI